MAAVQAIVDNYLRTAAPPTPQHRHQLLKDLLEEGVYGLDVLQSAVHLTASTLALPIPDVMARGMRLYTIPLGFVHKDGREIPRFGSIDLLSQAPVAPNLSLFPELGHTAERATDAQHQSEHLQLPPLDLVCMNPPFTRTCGDNLLFGSLPKLERTRMQRAFQEWCKRNGVEASITAGLGAVFIAVADRCLKTGGRLAFVLPKALLSGVEWGTSRELLRKSYTMEYLIVSHDPERWHFSENTDLSETLFVARKAINEGGTLCLNLWRNPDNPIDALTLAEEVRKLAPKGDAIQTYDLWLGDMKWGEAIYLPDTQFKSLPHWMLPCAYAQSNLNYALLELVKEHRYAQVDLPLAPLDTVGALGPGGNDLWDAFDPVDNPPGFPAFWGRDSKLMQTMSQVPNCYLVKIEQPRRPGRILRDPESLTARASQLLIAGRVRLNTLRTMALIFPTPVLSNVWLPLKLLDGDEDALKALCLWWNSSLYILLMLAHRVETHGAWVAFLRRAIARCPILNVKALPREVLQQMAQAFDALCEQPLLPLPQMVNDSARAQVDMAIAQALGLPDLTPLREQLAREPVICLQPLRQKRMSL